MGLFKFLFMMTFLIGSGAQAAGASGWGVNAGLGVPFLSQAGINYRMSDKFGFALGYNALDVTSGAANLKLVMPEVLVNYHPFSGAFFIGAGVGQENLKVKAVETYGSNEVSIEVSALTTILKTGWMWGLGNGGFWLGVDLAYIMPSGADQTITAPGVPTSDPAYVDAADSAKKFGETAYANITFLRLGWLF